MKIITIPVLSDNYAYLVIDEATNEAGVVDPSEAGPVADAVKREGVNFTTIINTHHHWDHVGGNKELVQEYPDLRVYGHKRDETRTPCISHMVDEGDTVSIGNLEGRFLFIPCHTSGHVAAYFAAEKVAFTGDTLFVAGCGRLFEGTAADMHNNMLKLSALPEDTRIYPGHEYTIKNLEFALTLEPNNAAVQAKLQLGSGGPGQESADHSVNRGRGKDDQSVYPGGQSGAAGHYQKTVSQPATRRRDRAGADPLPQGQFLNGPALEMWFILSA